MSEEHKAKISAAHLGKKKGPMSKEVGIRRSIALKGKFINEQSWFWKGDKVGYRALHAWVARRKGKPNFCEHCKATDKPYRSYNWANVSGMYTRDLTDWIRLCGVCHKKYDRKK